MSWEGAGAGPQRQAVTPVVSLRRATPSSHGGVVGGATHQLQGVMAEISSMRGTPPPSRIARRRARQRAVELESTPVASKETPSRGSPVKQRLRSLEQSVSQLLDNAAQPRASRDGGSGDASARSEQRSRSPSTEFASRLSATKQELSETSEKLSKMGQVRRCFVLDSHRGVPRRNSCSLVGGGSLRPCHSPSYGARVVKRIG